MEKLLLLPVSHQDLIVTALFEVFTVLKVYQNFSPNKCIHFFKKLIDQGFAFVYTDDIRLLAQTESHLLALIEQQHQICSSSNLKIA